MTNALRITALALGLIFIGLVVWLILSVREAREKIAMERNQPTVVDGGNAQDSSTDTPSAPTNDLSATAGELVTTNAEANTTTLRAAASTGTKVDAGEARLELTVSPRADSELAAGNSTIKLSANQPTIVWFERVCGSKGDTRLFCATTSMSDLDESVFADSIELPLTTRSADKLEVALLARTKGGQEIRQTLTYSDYR